MKNRFALLLTLVISLSTFAQSEVVLEKSDCFLKDCSFLEKYPNVEFGKLTVPEDYSQPEKRKIKIAFVIIKAVEKPVQNDPIIYFEGGWGAPLLNATYEYASWFPIKNRDLILFDYRGSGYSEPKLCDWLGEATWNDISKDLTNNEFESNQTLRFNTCLDSLELRKIDFNQYGSNTKTKDAVVLAEQLGYDSYNLFGISYGTRAILNFIRNAENSSISIRSAVLDSNSPMGDFMSQGKYGEDYVRVLNLFFKDCENDPACNEAHPNLKNRFARFLEDLDANPWVIELENGASFALNRHEINGQLFQMLYIRPYYKNIPLMLEEVMNRNGEAFGLLVGNIKNRIVENFNGLGMINFVYDHKATAQESRDYFKAKEPELYPFNSLGGHFDFYFSDNRIGTDSLESIAVTSNVQSLFLAGEYDPITPPAWTKEVAKGFENHYYFEIKKEGHGASFSPCGGPLLEEFFNNPTKRPSSDCIESLGENEVNFITSYYKNAKVSKFASGLFQFKNIPLIIGLVFILLFALINTFGGLRNWLVKRAKDGLYLNLASAGILVFLIALLLAINKTASSNSFLLAFGLSGSGIWLFYLIPVILGFVFLALVQWFKAKKTIWNILSAVSLFIFIVIVMNYQLFPNL